MKDNAYQSLDEHFAKIHDLKHVQAITSWDEAAMMPGGGGAARADAMTTLNVVIHGMTTDEKVGDWLAEARGQEANLDDWQRANLREMHRTYLSNTCMPSDLVARLKSACTRSEQAWRVHRANNDWQAMTPLLTEVVNLAREEAAVRAEATGLSPYDALLDQYEPGVRSVTVDALFNDLKDFLPNFVDQVLTKQAKETVAMPAGNFSIANQKALGLHLMGVLGFDFNHGRLDVSHHPFCGGIPDDVRITTRYDEENFVSSLMAVIHETGHALYEQGLPGAWRKQPVGVALSSGTHESQSLLMEMQACRTEAFLQFMAPLAQRAFLGEETEDPAWQAKNLHRLYTRVNRSFIRVDADEVTYPLHVILRYELEKALIQGDLEVVDLPLAWHEKMRTYLALDTLGNDQDGCLQDVHWPAGLFGYFPTYTLGAVAAAQLFAAASVAIDDLEGNIARGNFKPLLAWLRTNIHNNGKYFGLNELLTRATGQELSAEPFKVHLHSRYLR